MVGRKEAPSGWVAPYLANDRWYADIEIDLESIILINNFYEKKIYHNVIFLIFFLSAVPSQRILICEWQLNNLRK